MEQINLKNDIQIDKKMFCKMVFLYNSLNEGWNIKKEKELFNLKLFHKITKFLI
jgi:hypothetical protein